MSLIFEKPTIEDRDWINKVLNKERRSDVLARFGTYFIWSDYFNTRIAKFRNIFFVRFNFEGRECYLFPKGTKSILGAKNAMDVLLEDYKNSGLSELCISGIGRAHV